MIEGIPIAALGPVGGLLFIVFLPYIQMARGKLVPRSTLEDERADRDDWREAHRTSEQVREVQTAQLAELLELSRTTNSIIRALPRPENLP